MRPLLCHGEVLVVETDRDRWVGTVELRTDHVIVRTGRAGRPRLIDADSIVSIGPVGDDVA